MTTTSVRVMTSLVLLGCLVVTVVPAGVSSEVPGPELHDASDLDAEVVLQRAVHASRSHVVVADVVIVSLSAAGPTVTEIALRRGEDGRQQVGQAESWLIDRRRGAAVFEDEAGRLLRLDQVTAVPFQLEDAEEGYRVDVAGRAELDTGPAVAVTFTRDGILRERLFVDDATGLVVRRETYDMAGTPARLVAMTELDTDDAATMREPTTDQTAESDMVDWPRRRPVPHHELDLEAWLAPGSLPHGFDLRASYEVDHDGIQLVYGDGLYTLSVYEQQGRVDHTKLAGAVRTDVAGWPAYRWPGAEPERLVWTGDGRTFTVVTDAPMDVLADVVSPLPHEPHRTLPDRFRRGVTRLGRLLWPFA